MVVEVNNVRLLDDYEGFSYYREQLERAKVGFLLLLSNLFPDAHFVFYNIYGDFAMHDYVQNTLSGIFKSFEVSVAGEDVTFNSSPINNIPVVLIDGRPRVVEEAETIGLIRTDSVSSQRCAYKRCFTVVESPLLDRGMEGVYGLFVELIPKTPMEHVALKSLARDEERYVVLKILRGEDVCF
uniref:Uncharacterized protein n=1 Tax=Fervidobacterium thailandense TaxID=1008305 RepID=A0A7C4GIA1_9BACT